MPIPARAIEMVFDTMAEQKQVGIRWVAIHGPAMNIEHEPRDEFERNAVKAMTFGKPEFEQVEGNTYRRVGAIRLTSECLKCHAPSRLNNKDRIAGISISMTVLPAK